MLTAEEAEGRNYYSYVQICNHKSYAEFEGKPLPNPGDYLMEGNVIVEVERRGNGPVTKEMLNAPDARPWHRLEYAYGAYYWVRRTYYELTDGEMCWRY